MKKFYFLIFITTGCLINAQSLTQSFNEPVVGDRDRLYRIDTSAYTSGVPTSITGSNCVWNYTGLVGTFPIVVDSFKAPAAVPSATAFPSATYVQHRDVLFSFYKSTSSPQQTELLGAFSPSLSLTFTNSAIIAGYPVNYGYSLVDPVSGSFKYNTTNGACNGSITITADGVGTLNLANQSHSNVIRLKSVETLTLSIGILPFGSFNQTVYNYYVPGKKFPVLSFNYTTYQLLAGTPTITALIYGSDQYFSFVGIDEHLNDQKKYTAFPNPFQNTLELNKDALIPGTVIRIYTTAGQILKTGEAIEELDTETLNPGIYLFEIRNAEGVFRQKIIKE